MIQIVFTIGVLLVTACQQAFAGLPPATPDLDVSTLGYVSFAAAAGFVAIKRFLKK